MNQNIKPTSSKTANRKKFKGNMWSVVMKKNMKKKSKRIPKKGSQKNKIWRNENIFSYTKHNKNKEETPCTSSVSLSLQQKVIEHQSLRRAYEVFPKCPDKKR